jgi:hypothetical protein
LTFSRGYVGGAEIARLISSAKVDGTPIRRSTGDKVGTIEHG